MPNDTDADDPYVPFIFYLRKSKKQRIQQAADAKGVPLAVIGRWIHDLESVDDLLRSLTAPTNGARNDADHPSG